MKRCPNCQSEKLVDIVHDETLKVGGITFGTGVPAKKCEECGEIVLNGFILAMFEKTVAIVLAKLGVSSGDAIRYMRKSLGMRSAELADLLGMEPETLSRWEHGSQSANRNAVALLGKLVLEAAEKDKVAVMMAGELGEFPTTTMALLRSIRSAPTKPPKSFKMKVPPREDWPDDCPVSSPSSPP